jgi:branched-chain amino acid transport system ATP-binding protein
MASGAPPILEVVEATVGYGGPPAVDGVSIHVDTGTITGLIGPNGAGKTTLVDAITGFVPVSRGSVRFDGRPITRLKPHVRARRGLWRTFQSVELFDDLTVQENLLVAAERPPWHAIVTDVVLPPRPTRVDIDWALDILGLGAVRRRLPPELSQGQRKLVGVARALAGRPRVLVLDEPAAGLDTNESELLGEHLSALLDHDITLLLVDHDMSLVLGTCNAIWVLVEGRIIAHAPPAVVRADPAVISAYLGERNAERVS